MADAQGMGTTYVTARVSGPEGEDVEVKLLVDTGAVYTLLPEEVWRQLGLRPTRTQVFTLADGSEMRRAIGDCRIALPQGETPTPVILGEPGDAPLLGMVTLEALGFMLDPLKREVRPMTLRMVTAH